jgi:hypothetical protein
LTLPIVAPNDQIDWSNAVFRLRREPGLGPLPEYVISIYPDGLVEYEGINHVPLCGRSVTQIPPNQHARLVKAFQDSQFLSTNVVTKSYAFDSSSTVLGVNVGQGSRQLMHDAGVVPSLTALEKLMDDVAGIREWTTCEDHPCPRCPSSKRK